MVNLCVLVRIFHLLIIVGHQLKWWRNSGWGLPGNHYCGRGLGKPHEPHHGWLVIVGSWIHGRHLLLGVAPKHPLANSKHWFPSHKKTQHIFLCLYANSISMFFLHLYIYIYIWFIFIFIVVYMQFFPHYSSILPTQFSVMKHDIHWHLDPRLWVVMCSLYQYTLVCLSCKWLQINHILSTYQMVYTSNWHGW